MSITSFIRYLQGERRGMGSELKPPTPEQKLLAVTLYPNLFIAPAIAIETEVELSDVSFWQGGIDFETMLTAGLQGTIIRAGQKNWVDSKFNVNWQNAKAAGIPRGSYWFYDSRETPKKQAEIWAGLIENDKGELVHAADFEENYGGAYGAKTHFKDFLKWFQDFSHLPTNRIAVYTGFYWWIERVDNDPFFKICDLWLASYGSMQSARIPLPWTDSDLLFWQYTSSGDGPAHGVSSQEIDLNWYCCDQATYKERFNLEGEQPPMATYIYSITPTGSAGSKVRPEPDTGNTSFMTLPFERYAYGNQRVTIAEDKFENGVQVNKAGDIWLKVLEVNGSVLTQTGYIAEIHLGQRYATIEQINTPPNPEPSEDLVITQVISSPGYITQTVTTTLKPE